MYVKHADLMQFEAAFEGYFINYQLRTLPPERRCGLSSHGLSLTIAKIVSI